MTDAFAVRAMSRSSVEELDLVAARMRLTLIEVLGEAEGASMYTMEWLRERVAFHLDPAKSTGEVFVSVAADSHIAGHTIVRLEQEETGGCFGLFSTTWVEPESRRHGVASELLRRGELWIREHGVATARTYTSESNVKLIALYVRHGYALTERYPEKKMIVLEKILPTS